MVHGGCAEWPRLANLPEGGQLVDGSKDPATLIEIAWAADEDEAMGDNGAPNAADTQSTTIDVGEGFVVDGGLDGVGFDLGATTQVLEVDGCTGSPARVNPAYEGAYLGDLDFYVVEASSDGRMCMDVAFDRAALTDDRLGFDMLLWELDDCQLPTEPVVDGDIEVGGLDLAGARGSWHGAVSTGTYALMIGGYHPNEVESTVPYRLGVALVAGSENDVVACPSLPEETSR